MNLREIAWKYEAPAMFLKKINFPHIFLKKAEGIFFWDEKGRKFMDMTSFFGVMNFGHSPEFILKRLKNPEHILIHGLGDLFSNIQRVKLAEKLSNLLGGGYETVFLNTGAEACEMAIKTAYLYTGREYVISFRNAYHGLSGLALSITDRFQKNYFKPFLYKKIKRISFPEDEISAEKVFERIKKYIEKYGISSIIIEPIQGRGGINFPPPFFMKELREISKKEGIVLILDEIFTGLGRTGKMFAHQWHGIRPDIICLGKGLASGLPLSACIGKKEIMEVWNKDEIETLHASTFGGHPLACSIALEVIKKLEKFKMEEEIIKKGEYILKNIKELKGKYDGIIKDIRGKGLLLGVKLGLPEKIWRELLLKERILTLLEGKSLDILSLTPPFIINFSQIESFLNKFEKVLKKAI